MGKASYKGKVHQSKIACAFFTLQNFILQQIVILKYIFRKIFRTRWLDRGVLVSVIITRPKLNDSNSKCLKTVSMWASRQTQSQTSQDQQVKICELTFVPGKPFKKGNSVQFASLYWPVYIGYFLNGKYYLLYEKFCFQV